MPAKGYKKKDAKKNLVIRLSPTTIAQAKYNAERFCGGNFAAWISLRAMTRTDREFRAAYKVWLSEQKALWERRIRKTRARTTARER